RQSQTVVITATDSNGASSSTSFQLVVNNVAPTITALSANIVAGRRNVSVQGSFFDPGLLDTHVVTIDWGDGSAPQAVAVDELHQSILGSHQYSHGGTYSVTVTVTDSDGAAVSKTTTVKVTGNGSVNGI